MSLHNTVEAMKKFLIAASIGLGALLMLVIIVRTTIFFYQVLFPPKDIPPTVAYNELPALQFPPDALDGPLTYTVNTDTGEIPADFPDRLYVFPILHPEDNFLNLEKAKSKVKALGFVYENGQTVPERSLGSAVYEWNELSGLRRKMIFDTVTFDFNMTSSFLTYLPVLNGRNITPEDAIAATNKFLNLVALFPNDIDLEKTSNPNPSKNYVTYPKMFDIVNSTLEPATSLDRTKIVRVDLYQKNVTYELNTGKRKPGSETTIPIDYPILYPRPPFSTMSLWIGTAGTGLDVVQANYFHQVTQFPEEEASYPIKTAAQAYEELKSGDGYIAAAHGAVDGTVPQIFIKDIYLAYYLGETRQDYLMPVYVFEGENGFFAYVSAITDEWIQ